MRGVDTACFPVSRSSDMKGKGGKGREKGRQEPRFSLTMGET